MKVLVTGASGFLGSGVVPALLECGHEVRCLVRAQSDTERIQGLDWERVEGDILDRDSLDLAMSGCQGVIHLAGTSDWMEIGRESTWASIVDGTHLTLEAAREAGCERFVFVSTISSINGSDAPVLMTEETECTLPLEHPAFLYVKAKIAAEVLCREVAQDGFGVVIANPPETYGPNDTDLITARNLINLYQSKPVLVTRGGALVGYIDDVARGIVAALEKGRSGERYVLGGENCHVPVLARTMFDILGENRRIIRLPNWLVRLITFLGSRLHLPLPYNPLIIPYATRFWHFDTQKARRELGVEFRGLRESLTPTLQWLRESRRIG